LHGNEKGKLHSEIKKITHKQMRNSRIQGQMKNPQGWFFSTNIEVMYVHVMDTTFSEMYM
jgi:hypothetical protein